MHVSSKNKNLTSKKTNCLTYFFEKPKKYKKSWSPHIYFKSIKNFINVLISIKELN